MSLSNHCHTLLLPPFGVLLKGRNWSTEEYRYGFNGKEGDDEIAGEGNDYDFGARMYDGRLGRFVSLDIKTNGFHGTSGYIYSLNCPILFVDMEGEDPILGQIVMLPDGRMGLKLYWFSLLNDAPFYHFHIMIGIIKPTSNPQIALLDAETRFKEGMLGLTSEMENAQTMPGKGAAAMALALVALDGFKSRQEILKDDLRKQDKKEIENYETNWSMIHYYRSEAKWLFNAFSTAVARNVFKDQNIEKHGENISLDLVNYVLLKNSDYISTEKGNFTIYGDLAGLTREEYIEKLDVLYLKLVEDKKVDTGESYEVVEIAVESKSGDNVVFETTGKSFIRNLKAPAYLPEPKVPIKKK